jgi:hypothetical protein
MMTFSANQFIREIPLLPDSPTATLGAMWRLPAPVRFGCLHDHAALVLDSHGRVYLHQLLHGGALGAPKLLLDLARSRNSPASHVALALDQHLATVAFPTAAMAFDRRSGRQLFHAEYGELDPLELVFISHRSSAWLRWGISGPSYVTVVSLALPLVAKTHRCECGRLFNSWHVSRMTCAGAFRLATTRPLFSGGRPLAFAEDGEAIVATDGLVGFMRCGLAGDSSQEEGERLRLVGDAVRAICMMPDSRTAYVFADRGRLLRLRIGPQAEVWRHVLYADLDVSHVGLPFVSGGHRSESPFVFAGDCAAAVDFVAKKAWVWDFRGVPFASDVPFERPVDLRNMGLRADRGHMDALRDDLRHLDEFQAEAMRIALCAPLKSELLLHPAIESFIGSSPETVLSDRHHPPDRTSAAGRAMIAFLCVLLKAKLAAERAMVADRSEMTAGVIQDLASQRSRLSRGDCKYLPGSYAHGVEALLEAAETHVRRCIVSSALDVTAAVCETTPRREVKAAAASLSVALAACRNRDEVDELGISLPQRESVGCDRADFDELRLRLQRCKLLLDGWRAEKYAGVIEWLCGGGGGGGESARKAPTRADIEVRRVLGRCDANTFGLRIACCA